MSTGIRARDHYRMLLQVNQESFDDGHREVAAHALAAALHCAIALGAAAPYDEVEQWARAQQEQIDARAPGERMSTAWSRARGSQTVFESVARQAQLLASLARAGRGPRAEEESGR